MSFKATLKVENTEFEVLKCVSDMEQDIDATGRVRSAVKGGNLRLVLRGNNEETLTSWALKKTTKYGGTITFMKMDGLSKFREIKFEDAYITWFAESFRFGGDEENFENVMQFSDDVEKEMFHMVTSAHEQFKSDYLVVCKLSALRITIDGVEHDNVW
jgi:hypothetical protein